MHFFRPIPSTLFAAFASLSLFAAPIRFEVETGDELHILRDGEDGKLQLVAFNDNEALRSGTLSYQISDVDDRVLFKAVAPVEIPSAGSCRVALPIPEKFGPYSIRAQFENEGGDLRKLPPLRFARLEPAGPVPAETPETFLFGISAHYDYREYSTEEYEKMSRAAALCGARIIRTDARWNMLQPQAGTWEFDWFDRAVNLINKYRLDPAVIVDIGAAWTHAADWKPAVPECPNSWAARPDYEAWRNYIRTVTERYKGKIRFIEVMNEINMYPHHNFTPEEYGELLRIAHDEIRRIDPDVRILSSGLASVRGNLTPTKNWYGRFFRAADDNYDIFAFHNHGHFTDYVGEVRAVGALREAAKDDHPVWANETALSSAMGGERFQAETLYCKLLYSWAGGMIGYNWYNLRDKPADDFPADSPEPHFGLITADFHPKPVYVAYNTLAKNFAGAEFLENYNTQEIAGRDVYAFLFRHRNGGYLLSFFRTGDDTTLQLVTGITGKAFLCDLWGNETPLPLSDGTAAIPVGPRPFFLRFEEQEKAPVLLGEFLSPEHFFLFPGRKQTARFQLRNPGGTPLAVKLRIPPIPGLKITPAEMELTAAPGEVLPVEFTFDAAPDFREGEMKLQIDAGQLWRGSLHSILKPAIRLTTQFTSLPTMTIDRPEQVVRLVEHEPSTEPLYWKGPQDVSARVWIAQADHRLKLQIEVRDDRHCQPWSDSQLWRGDSIQLGIQLPRQDVFWEIGFARRDDGTEESFIWSLPNGFDAAVATRRITLKTERNEVEKITRYEAEIPFNAIGLTPEMGRDGFQFNLLVNDCDDGSTRESFISAAPGLGDTKNPVDFPTVCF